MPTRLTALFLCAALALPACDQVRDDDVLFGAAAGAALGAITAKILLEDDDWVVIGALAGAAAGTLVARNRERNRCAYSRGDGTFYTARCP